MIYYTVYKIINSINNKYYIGVHKTKNPHDSYYGSGKIIKEAIHKYGKEKFIKEILFTFDTAEEAYQKEKELVNIETLSDPLIYNIQIGGIPTVEWTEEQKIKKSVETKGENHPYFGKKLSQEHKDKISKASTGRKHSQETIDKIVNSRKNNGKTSALKGRSLSEKDKFNKSIAALNKAKVECPHCKKILDPGNAKRWHFDNCSELIISKVGLE